jgi:hypothetical protein
LGAAPQPTAVLLAYTTCWTRPRAAPSHGS